MTPPPSLLLRLFAATFLVAISPLCWALAPEQYVPPLVLTAARFFDAHPVGYAAITLGIFMLLILATRKFLHFWFNIIRPYIAGTKVKESSPRFDVKPVDLMQRIMETHKNPALKGSIFIGERPPQRIGGESTPAYLIDRLRTMHIDVVGATGTGKTASIVAPFALQDILAGKGIMWVTFKGGEEEFTMVRNFCQVAGRTKDLRIVALEAKEPFHRSNPLYISPRTPKNPTGGNPLAVSERVFSVFKTTMMNDYYREQANIFFRATVAILHGMLDEKRYSLPFDFTDVLEIIRNEEARKYCLARTVDTAAAHDMKMQLLALGNKATETFTGLQVLVQNYAAVPQLNASNPDVILRDAMQNNQILFFQLPANFVGGVSEAFSQILLQEMTQAAAERQLDRSRNQRPFAVYIDEFYNAAYDGFIGALNKLRDAQIQMLIAHQSISDLERISKEFAAGVYDNTRTKFFLAQSNPVLCEHIAKSIGTHQVQKTTSQRSVGDLAVALDAGEHSVREVEEFILHPNCLKSLAPQGQAYMVEGPNFTPLNLGCIPQTFLIEKPKEKIAPRKPEKPVLKLTNMFGAGAPPPGHPSATAPTVKEGLLVPWQGGPA